MNAPPTAAPAPPPPRPRPWLSLGIALSALALPALGDRAVDALVFERPLILHGEAWRLWTGHLVHFSPSHLGWNLVVFAPASFWLESLSPRSARLLLALAPVAISLTLLGVEPALARYGGLSGLATGVLTLLALARLRAPGADPWVWRGVLALVAAKIGLEFALERPLFARFATDAIRGVPAAHLAGAACALAVFALGLRLPGRPRA